MMSKKWLTFIGFLLLICFFDTISIVTTRMIPNKFSDIAAEECVPKWTIIRSSILQVFNPYAKFFQYVGFLCLFVRQCKQQLKETEPFVNRNLYSKIVYIQEASDLKNSNQKSALVSLKNQTRVSINSDQELVGKMPF